MTKRRVAFGAAVLAASVAAGGEYLVNGSFDASEDGKTPSGWEIAKNQKTVYREAAVLSGDKVLEISRDHTTRTLWQPISGKSPKKLCFRFDATPLRYKVYIAYEGGQTVTEVHPKTRNAIYMPEGCELKEFMFRIETDGRPCTVTLNNFSLKPDTNPFALDLVPYGSIPETKGRINRYKPRSFMTEPKTAYRVLVMLYSGMPVADLIAEDFAGQFGWQADVVTGKKTLDPERVQKAFDRGDYVLLVQGDGIGILSQTNSPIARYVERGGTAVFFGTGAGRQFRGGAIWVNDPRRANDPMFDELAMSDISPADYKGVGIDVISETKYGKGRAAQVSFRRANGFRHGLWPGVDEKNLTLHTHDVQERLGLKWMDCYPAVYAKLMMRLNGDWTPVAKPAETELVKDRRAGRHLVTTVARDAEGRATGWRTDGVDVRYDDLPMIEKVEVSERRFKADEGIGYEVTLSGGHPDARLEYAAVDGARRVLASGTVPSKGRITFAPGMLQLPAVTVKFRTVNAKSGHSSRWKGVQCYVADEDPAASRMKYLTAGYLWIPLQYRRPFREIFRELGINTENCWIPAAYGATADGLRWTDGWGGPIEKEGYLITAMQEQGIHGHENYGDDPVKKHWKSGCMNEPKWREALKTMIGKYADTARANPPYMYAICDEMTHASPWLNYHAKDCEPCRRAPCLERFRSAMRAKYGNIAALNAKWGTSFKDFGSLMPALTGDVRGNGGRYASWVEFRAFMDDVMAEVSSDVVAVFGEKGVDVAAGQPNWCYRTPVTGVDPAKVVSARTGGQDYGPEKSVGSFRRKDAPVLSWVGYFDYDNIGRTIWQSLINGGSGLMLYATFQTCNEWREGYLTEYGRISANAEKLGAVLRPLASGVGDMLNAAGSAPAEAVVLDSQASMYVAWLEDSLKEFFGWGDRNKNHDTFGPYLNWFRSNEQWEKVLHTLRVRFTYAGEADLSARLAEAKVLILPNSYALSEKTRAAVRAFAERGGLVVYDRVTGLFDETGDRTGPAFRDSLKGCDLEAAIADVNDETFLARMRGVFAAAGVKPDYDIVRAADGKIANGLAVDVRFLSGSGDSKALLIAGRAQDDGISVKHGRRRFKEVETDLVLKLAAPKYVRDLNTRRDYGLVREVRWSAAEGYKAFRLDPVPMGKAEVKVSGEMKPGSTLEIGVEGALSTVYHLRVYDSEGVEQWAYRKNSPLTRNWRTKLGIPVNAANLPWRVEVRN